MMRSLNHASVSTLEAEASLCARTKRPAGPGPGVVMRRGRAPNIERERSLLTL